MFDTDDKFLDKDLDEVRTGRSQLKTLADIERRKKLLEKQDSQRRTVLDDSRNGRTDKDNRTKMNYWCVNCGHSFVVDPSKSDFTCPFCKARHHSVQAEEIHLTRRDSAWQAKLEEHGAERKSVAVASKTGVGRRGVSPVRIFQDTNVNDAKNQFSLQLGSAEYLEYLRDREESSPFAKDDEFHAQLEQRNEELPEQLSELNAHEDMSEYLDRRALSEAKKREVHDEAVAFVKARAGRTETLADDTKISRIGMDNPILHDIGVSDDKYDDALLEYAGLG